MQTLHYSDDISKKVWKHEGEQVNVIKAKNVFYECGCVVHLSEWGINKDAPLTCKKHLIGIKKIITIEEYFRR